MIAGCISYLELIRRPSLETCCVILSLLQKNLIRFVASFPLQSIHDHGNCILCRVFLVLASCDCYLPFIVCNNICLNISNKVKMSVNLCILLYTVCVGLWVGIDQVKLHDLLGLCLSDHSYLIGAIFFYFLAYSCTLTAIKRVY